MYGRIAFQSKKGEEANRCEWDVCRPAVQRHDLRQHVEENNRYYGSGTEPEQ
jgi:hypothetical protein